MDAVAGRGLGLEGGDLAVVEELLRKVGAEFVE